MTKDNSKAARVLRRDQAEDRQKEYDALSNEERIAVIDARLGAGVGATKERARLASDS